MSKNKGIKNRLQQVYGEGCFFERANIPKQLERYKNITSFKKFCEQKRFTGKSISYQLTVHHLRHRSEGGDTSIDNCSVVAEIAHQYLHSLPRDEEEIINNMLREFKMNIAILKGRRNTSCIYSHLFI